MDDAISRMLADAAVREWRPFNLRHWRLASGDAGLHLYTCARPGRTAKDASRNWTVTDEKVDAWVSGLPGPGTAVVLLLGTKPPPDGKSEYKFYPSIRGAADVQTEHAGKVTFAEWLVERHPERGIVLREHPTVDTEPIGPAQLGAIEDTVREFWTAGRTVVVVDSGGVSRTGLVARALALRECATPCAIERRAR